MCNKNLDKKQNNLKFFTKCRFSFKVLSRKSLAVIVSLALVVGLIPSLSVANISAYADDDSSSETINVNQDSEPSESNDDEGQLTNVEDNETQIVDSDLNESDYYDTDEPQSENSDTNINLQEERDNSKIAERTDESSDLQLNSSNSNGAGTSISVKILKEMTEAIVDAVVAIATHGEAEEWSGNVAITEDTSIKAIYVPDDEVLNLYLLDDTTLTVDATLCEDTNYPGINCGHAKSFYVTSCAREGQELKGTGKLVVKGKGNAAGIGGAAGVPGHDITIENCIVDAKGGDVFGSSGAAIGGGINARGENITIRNAESVIAQGNSGIGGGYDGGTATNNIVIDSSNVTAIANSGHGAAIGAGGRSSAKDITIKNQINPDRGCTVKAESRNNDCAAIGTGWNSLLGSVAENISIEDSTVEAVCKDGGAGIGGGIYSHVEGIYIKDSDVTAVGGHGSAGIGSGQQSNCKTIVIDNSKVTATTDNWTTQNFDGAAIGSGYFERARDILIKGDDTVINATAQGYGAGIGSGSHGKLIEGDEGYGVKIEGGTINAISEKSGAGIGSGGSGEDIGDYAEAIYIKGGVINATSKGRGAGIGGGEFCKGKDIYIQAPAVVTARACDNGAGIGGGYDSINEGIEITGGTVVASSADCGAGIGTGSLRYRTTRHYSKDITISGGDITAYAEGGYGCGIGGGYNGSCQDLTISGGLIKATAPKAAAIGSGWPVNDTEDGAPIAKNISVTGGRVEAQGGASGDQLSCGIGCSRYEDQAEKKKLMKNITVSTKLTIYRSDTQWEPTIVFENDGGDLAEKSNPSWRWRYHLIDDGSLKNITVGDQTPILKYGEASTSSYSLSYKSISLSKLGLKWYRDNTCTVECEAPMGITSSLAEATVSITSDGSTPAGNYFFKVEGDGAASNVGSFIVKKRSVIITGQNATKIYDGTPLTFDKASVDGFVAGEGVELSFTGSQTDVGKSSNPILYAAQDDTNLDNYDISVTDGSLEVVKGTAIKLQAGSAAKAYDGTALESDEYEIVSGDICNNQVMIVTLSGSITNVGQVNNTIASVAVYDAEGTDVTANYNVGPHSDGILEVTPAQVYLQSGSSSKVYDGTALTNDNVDKRGLVGEDSINAEAKGTQTYVGTSDNTFTYNFTKGDPNNYTVNVIYGKLTITPVDTLITVTANSATKTYDGTALVDTGYVKDGDLVAGDALTATVVGSITNAGYVTNEITSVVVTNAGGEDVTGCYSNIQKVNGTLTVNKLDVVLYTKSVGSKTEFPQSDGKVYSDNDCAEVYDNPVFLSSLVGGKLYSEGKATEAGVPVSNAIKYVFVDSIISENNFNVIKNEGILLNISDEAQIEGVLPSYSGQYDGQFHSVKLTLADEGLRDKVVYEIRETGTETWTPTGYEGKDLPSIKMVGKIEARAKIIDGGNTYISNTATLEVTPRTGVVITAGSASKKYDANALTCNDIEVTGNIVSGEELTASIQSECTITNVGSIANKVDTSSVVIKSGSVVVTDQYKDFIFVDGLLKVTPRYITLVSGSSCKAYDGTALKNTEVKKLGDGFVEHEEPEITTTASQTDAGSSVNKISVTFDPAVEESNYVISKVEGLLVVTKAAIPIIVTAKSYSKTYDGTALTIADADPGYTVYGTIMGDAGDTLTASVSGKSGIAGSTPTDAETIMNTVLSLEIKRGITDVSSNYKVLSSVPGALTVNPKAINLTSATDSKVYDGNKLTNNFISGTEEFVSGQGATYDVTGAQLNAGSSDNTFTYTLTGGTKAQNYNITCTYGLLTVTKRPVSLYSKSATSNIEEPLTMPRVYGDNAYSQEPDSVFKNCVVDGTLRASGYVDSKADGRVINTIKYTFIEPEFESNFSVTKYEGFLQIVDESSLSITYDSYNGVYDGTTHGLPAKCDGATSIEYLFYFDSDPLTPELDPNWRKWINGQEGHTTDYPVITNADTCHVKCTCTKDGVTTSVLSYLYVAPRSVELYSNSHEKTYDGTALTDSNVSVEGDGFLGTEASASASGSIIDYGSETNTIDITTGAGYLAQNYNINKHEGSLTINKIETPIILKAAYGVNAYDGKAYTKDLVLTPNAGEVLVEGEEIVGLHAAPASELINVGSTNNKIQAGYKVQTTRSGTTVDTTANYNFTEISGQLNVIQRKVILRSDSAIKTYDGTPLTASGVTVAGQGFADGEGATYQTYGTRTNVFGDTTEDKYSENEFVYTLNSNTNPNNYKIIKVNGILRINQRSVELYSKSKIALASETSSLSAPGVYCDSACTGPVDSVFENDVTNLVANTVVTETDKAVTNTITYTYPREDAGLSNFIVSKSEGQLYLSTTDTGLVVPNYEGLYDNFEHSCTAITMSPTATTVEYRSSTDEGKTWTRWSEEAPSISKVLLNSNKDVIAMQCQAKLSDDTATTNYTLKLNKRNVTFVSMSDQKVYDGTPLRNNTVLISAGAIAQGDAEPDYAGFRDDAIDVQTDTSDSILGYENTFIVSNYEAGEGSEENTNYTLNKIYGTLTILPNPTPIWVKAGSDTWTYDALEHSCNDYTYRDNVLLDGETLTVTMTEDSKITDAGSVANKIGDIKIVRDAETNEEKDITANYNIAAAHSGLLTVDKKLVGITSDSAAKEYDGTPLKAENIKIDPDNKFVGDEGVEASNYAFRLRVGTNQNTFDYSAKEGTNLDNYNLVINYGSLTVNPAQVPISVTPNDATRTYNGHALEANEAGYTTNAASVVADFEQPESDDASVSVRMEVEMRGSVLDVGTSTSQVISARLIKTITTETATNEIDITDQYSWATFGEGKLEVTPASINIVANSAEKQYDGTPLTGQDAGYSLGEGSQFADTDTLNVALEGQQTEVGTSINKVVDYSICRTGGCDKSANYVVSTTDGELKVTSIDTGTMSSTGSTGDSASTVAGILALAALCMLAIVIAARRKQRQ